MSKITFNQQHKDVLDSILLTIPAVTPGKMFGYPAYYVKGKLFACVYENGVGVKVPEAVANELVQRNEVDYFQPLGRKKMKQWIQINRKNSEDFIEDKDIFDISVEFVASLAGIKLQRKMGQN